MYTCGSEMLSHEKFYHLENFQYLRKHLLFIKKKQVENIQYNYT